MILALVALLSTASAHSARYSAPPVVIHEAPGRDLHWVSAHFDRWGRWIPGHWISSGAVEIIECRADRRGVISCIVR